MKKLSKILVPVLVLATLLISACTGAAAPADTSVGSKVQAAPVEFTGVITNIDGNLWTVDGQVITVDPSVLRDGPFNVGDTVKVQVDVLADGSMAVTRVESPSADATELPEATDVSNTPDPAGTPDPITGGPVFDNKSSEAFGTVDTITADSIVIGGQTYTIANGAELNSQIQAGDFVKVHFSLNADGTMTITEIEISNPSLNQGDDSNSDTNEGVDANNNDDNSNDGSTDKSGSSGDHQNKDGSNSGGGNDNTGAGGGHD